MPHRRNRYYAGMMLFSGVALLVDRCVLPDSAGAPDAALAAPAIAPPATPTTGPRSIPEVPFPHRVAAFSSARPLRDVFLQPARQGGGGAADNSGRAGPKAAGPATTDRATFMTQHRLEGTLIDQGLRIAVVDGRWLRAGQVLDDCALESVAGDSVTFTCSDGPTTLFLMPIGAAPGR